MVRIGMIVEGQGDAASVPILIRRIATERNRFDIQLVSPPFRVKRGRLASRFPDFENALTFLAGKADEVIALFDSDDDDPGTLEAEMAQRAGACAGHIGVSGVLAVREFEAWFLAGIESLRGYRDVPSDAQPVPSPELIRGAKGAFASLLSTGIYSETVDQPKYAAQLGLAETARNSPSFSRFVEATRGALDRHNSDASYG